MRINKTFIRNIIMIATGSFFSVTVLANSGLKSRVKYLNQNNCRVFDMVVDPNCPYDLSPRTCAATQQALHKIKEANPKLTLRTSCSRVHTGDPVKRILIETLMQSSSFDGYAIKMILEAQPRGTLLIIHTSLADSGTCLLAAEALSSFDKKGLNASATCNGEKLTAQLQF